MFPWSHAFVLSISWENGRPHLRLVLAHCIASLHFFIFLLLVFRYTHTRHTYTGVSKYCTQTWPPHWLPSAQSTQFVTQHEITLARSNNIKIDCNLINATKGTVLPDWKMIYFIIIYCDFWFFDFIILSRFCQHHNRKSCSPCQSFCGVWKCPNSPACTENARVFKMLKLDATTEEDSFYCHHCGCGRRWWWGRFQQSGCCAAHGSLGEESQSFHWRDQQEDWCHGVYIQTSINTIQ